MGQPNERLALLMKPSPTSPAPLESPENLGSLGTRAVLGGTLMGLANLVPGISGGTMLLASGIYPRFIQAIADLTTLKLRKSSLIVLAAVGGSAGIAILFLAGMVKGLVVDHRWVMYSLFIGLTLGGLPVVWSMSRPANRQTWLGAGVGFVGMALIAWAQASGAAGDGESHGWLLMLLAGIAGASAMILPGVSGGYLLLVLGVYVPILAAIDSVKEALKSGNLALALDPGLNVVLPVGIGVAIGVLAVSNLLQWLLAKFEKPTLGALLGLLVGAVIGLWPFQEGVPPAVGEVYKGVVMTPESIAELPKHKYPTEYFTPTVGHILGALALIAVGFAITALVARLGAGKEEAKAHAQAGASHNSAAAS